MKLLLLSAVFVLSALGFGQTPAPVTPNGQKSDEILLKIRQVDAMVQILPLAMTKEQIRAILPAIEKSRQQRIEILKMEDADLAKLDAKLTEAVKNGLEKQAYPPRELQTEVYKLTRALSIRRDVATSEMVDRIYEAVDKALNAGQKKAMENSLDPKLLGDKVERMTSEQKVKYFIRQIFLDSAAYDVLSKLSI